ncbi:MAG: ribonuclease P protein component [Candidatus Zambryskibacteria bacterium]|nr:ribonuclease P protein component [Candidatus Zambryskibacteria bacterium]
MLPKKRRIQRKDFPLILSKNKRYNSPNLLLHVTPINSNKTKESRFSFSVSKKVCPKATDRNKYRRQGYSVISKNLNRIKPEYYCFFSFKKTSKPIIFSALEKEILELLSSSLVLI